MISRWRWVLRQLMRRLWFRATLLSGLAVVTALLAIWLQPYIPYEIPGKIGAEAVDNILGILASSMLAVTTFSLSTMVAAYSAATSSATPRATKLLIEDTTAQNALATFLGSFLFSLVGIIVLSTGAYGDKGRVILFVATLFVIGLIVVTLLRWIDHLTRLGRVGETTQRVEKAALEALLERRAAPYLGGRPLDPAAVPGDAVPVFGEAVGYVQHIDLGSLQRALGETAHAYVLVLPGSFVDPTRPLALLAGGTPALADDVRDVFSIGGERSFDQDPRFGLTVLTEIGQRALSTAINDAGTAIDVIGRTVRLLVAYLSPRGEPPEVAFPSVFVPALRVEDLIDDVFHPLARDGAASTEVGIRLLKALRTLGAIGDETVREAARRHAALLMRRAEAAGLMEEDLARLRAVG